MVLELRLQTLFGEEKPAMVCAIVALLIPSTAFPRPVPTAPAVTAAPARPDAELKLTGRVPDAVSGRTVVAGEAPARPTSESTSASYGASAETSSGPSRALPVEASQNALSLSA